MAVEQETQQQIELYRKYGLLPWPHFFDDRAKQGYDRPYAYIARSPNPQDGFREISYSCLANAINRVSWWLTQELADVLGEGQVFAYLGPSDLRYLMFTVAAMKTGRIMLTPSIRNTVEAQKQLFQRVDCKLVVYASALEKSLQPLFDSMPDLTKRVAPDLDTLLDDSVTAPHYVCRTVDEKHLHDPILLFHTSGSSGNPKPIVYTPAVIRSFSSHELAPTDGKESSIILALRRQINLFLLPPFHAAGFFVSLLSPYFDGVTVLPHPSVPPTAEHNTALLQQNLATSLFSPPSLLSDMAKKPDSIDLLSKLEHVCYVGGPLPEHAGKILAPRLKHLWSLIGATEYGFFHTLAGDSSQWAYIQFNPHVGYRFDEVSPGHYEMVIPKNPATNHFHGTVYTFPDLDEYRTRDLYTVVPGQTGWLRYEGRRDDLIVLSNGEKINPVPLEGIISSHPAVKGAVIVGEYRFLPCLLVELKEGYAATTPEERQQMLDSLWPVINKANMQAPRFSRISKALVYILSPTEAFSRASKGTIQRQASVRKFAKQVEELYSAAEQGLLVEGLEVADPKDIASIRELVRKLYLQVLDRGELADDEDVFELGMDSLQVAIAVQKLRAALRAREVEVDYERITPQLFYSSPTINKLAHSLDVVVNGHQTNGTAINGTGGRRARLQEILDRYLAGLSDQAIQSKEKESGNPVVILTGSTGSLGSYLLATLLSSPKVSKVICLNRSSDAETRQKASFKQRGLDTSWDDQRVEFLTADLSKPDLGLDSETYTRLVSSAGALIHNAWKVDFNHTIETFEKSNIAGVRHLIDFSGKCKYQTPIMFVSSISSCLNWITAHPDKLVPEEIIDDLEAPEMMGYGESKYVGERLLEAFTKASGIPTAVLRVGQIAGPVLSAAGSWNVREWFPSLVASSKYLGQLPTSLGTMGTISWIPVDVLAVIIVQLLEVLIEKKDTEAATAAPAVYNLVNPKVTEWSTLLPTVQEQLGGPSKIRTVPLKDWTEALERSAGDNHGYVVAENPGVKLLEFFKLMERGETRDEMRLEYEVTRLTRDSPEASKLQAVSPDWIKIWMRQWDF